MNLIYNSLSSKQAIHVYTNQLLSSACLFVIVHSNHGSSIMFVLGLSLHTAWFQ